MQCSTGKNQMPEPLLFISAWALGASPFPKCIPGPAGLILNNVENLIFHCCIKLTFCDSRGESSIGSRFFFIFLAWKSRSLISLYCLCSHICPDAGGCAMSVSGFLFRPDGCNCAIEAPYLIHFLDLRFFLLATSSHFPYSGSCIVLI